jgi:hypothetical protein
MNPNGVIWAYGPEAAADYFVSYASGEMDGGHTVEYCIDLKNFGVDVLISFYMAGRQGPSYEC